MRVAQARARKATEKARKVKVMERAKVRKEKGKAEEKAKARRVEADRARPTAEHVQDKALLRGDDRHQKTPKRCASCTTRESAPKVTQSARSYATPLANGIKLGDAEMKEIASFRIVRREVYSWLSSSLPRN